MLFQSPTNNFSAKGEPSVDMRLQIVITPAQVECSTKEAAETVPAMDLQWLQSFHNFSYYSFQKIYSRQ